MSETIPPVRMYLMNRLKNIVQDETKRRRHNMTDAEWYSLLQTSPREARRVLIEQYANLVYAIVRNKLGGVASREDIEDCVSDVFVALFEQTQSYRPENGSLKGYLSTIAKRTAIDAWRRLTYRQNITSSMDEDETLVLPAAQDDTEQEVMEKFRNKRLWEIIKGLGEPDTAIIIRQYFYEQTAKEIGNALSMTAAAVQKRSIRARARIKELLQAEQEGELL
ncbi:MAG: sigma-70 family RNA polymerase sigma factor [Ruminococcus sp.]|nr:sigma-70 family RNA polymerase sigma factor [Ruminococcus sp.]